MADPVTPDPDDLTPADAAEAGWAVDGTAFMTVNLSDQWDEVATEHAPGVLPGRFTLGGALGGDAFDSPTDVTVSGGTPKRMPPVAHHTFHAPLGAGARDFWLTRGGYDPDTARYRVDAAWVDWTGPAAPVKGAPHVGRRYRAARRAWAREARAWKRAGCPGVWRRLVVPSAVIQRVGATQR